MLAAITSSYAYLSRSLSSQVGVLGPLVGVSLSRLMARSMLARWFLLSVLHVHVSSPAGLCVTPVMWVLCCIGWPIGMVTGTAATTRALVVWCCAIGESAAAICAMVAWCCAVCGVAAFSSRFVRVNHGGVKWRTSMNSRNVFSLLGLVLGARWF